MDILVCFKLSADSKDILVSNGAINTDRAEFGGAGIVNEGVIDTVAENSRRSAKLDLPGRSAIILRPVSPVRRAKADNE